MNGSFKAWSSGYFRLLVFWLFDLLILFMRWLLHWLRGPRLHCAEMNELHGFPRTY